MTESEIKMRLEVLKDWVGNASLTRQDCQKAIDETIQILDEIQEYRAIGTVEELQELKEESRFLEFLYDRILPNEMEQYLSMYKASDIKTNGE